MTTIVENKLYLGSICETPPNNITCIINLSGEKHKEKHRIRKQQIKIYNIELEDSPETPIETLFDYVINIIEHEPCVYIYCLAGISRSPTMVAAYLMHKYSMTTEESIEYIRERRPQVMPNEGFMIKLRATRQAHP